MKLKFIGTEGIEIYHGKTGQWNSGEIKEIQDEIAKRFLSDFPKNFFESEAEEEKSVTSSHDKAMKTKHDK